MELAAPALKISDRPGSGFPLLAVSTPGPGNVAASLRIAFRPATSSLASGCESSRAHLLGHPPVDTRLRRPPLSRKSWAPSRGCSLKETRGRRPAAHAPSSTPDPAASSRAQPVATRSEAGAASSDTELQKRCNGQDEAYGITRLRFREFPGTSDSVVTLSAHQGPPRPLPGGPSYQPPAHVPLAISDGLLGRSAPNWSASFACCEFGPPGQTAKGSDKAIRWRFPRPSWQQECRLPPPSLPWWTTKTPHLKYEALRPNERRRPFPPGCVRAAPSSTSNTRRSTPGVGAILWPARA